MGLRVTFSLSSREQTIWIQTDSHEDYFFKELNSMIHLLTYGNPGPSYLKLLAYRRPLLYLYNFTLFENIKRKLFERYKKKTLF